MINTAYRDALEPLLDRVQRPARYIGGEHNIVRKDPRNVAIRVCLAFPDAYEIGMSHLGLRILYDLLNRHDDIYAERTYCPFPDMEHELRAAELPLASFETFTPLHEFDVVGFSLQSELNNTNVLTMLDLGGIPLHRRDRNDSDPLVIAGGPVVFNPEPVSDFFDLFLIGDGEQAIFDLIRLNRRLINEGVADRTERLRRLANTVIGLYAPVLHETQSDERTGFVRVVPGGGDGPYPVRKALVEDLGEFPYPRKTLVGQTEIVHDRTAVEIARGCTEGCRFCQAGIIYRPVRERKPLEIVDAIESGLDATGYDEASLTALSTADYSCVTPLARKVMEGLVERRTAMSVSSLRVYGVTEELAQEIARVRKTGFTIAPEAGTQRMRDVVNKGITDENIDTAARIAFANGWNRLKLYFMIGLPTETDDDVLGIAETAIRVMHIGRQHKARGLNVVVSVSNFVPKPHSTFQWVPFDEPEELHRKQRMLRDRLRKFSAIRLNCHGVDTSALEVVFARGDRRLGGAIETAWRNGARFDEWSEHFRKDVWDAAFAECGIAPADFRASLPTDDHLVWDHIDSRVEKKFLLKDLRYGLKARFLHPCEKPYLPKWHNPPRDRDGHPRLVCYDCGVDCDLKAIAIEREEAAAALGEKYPLPIMHASVGPIGAGNKAEAPILERDAEQDPKSQPVPTPPPQPAERYYYRLRFTKTGLTRFIGHLDLSRMIERALRRAKSAVAYSEGFHPHPKLTFAPALPVGVASVTEFVDVETVELYTTDELEARLNSELPETVRVLEIVENEARPPSLAGCIDHFVYRIDIPVTSTGLDADRLRVELDRRLTEGGWTIERQSKKGARQIDVVPYIAASVFAEEGGTMKWELTLRAVESRTVKARELVESLIGEYPAGTVITRVKMGRMQDSVIIEPMTNDHECFPQTV